jgi:2-polyprenyl-6-methoxyphenol hydroxylase-like FAD-dependent oxidoreductase
MKPITVIGGGLAGLTLGVALRQREVPVTVFEAGRYPRHRVCGEFISGRGRDVLTALGLEEKFLTAGARPARTAAFFSVRGRAFLSDLPEPALCLSRYVMDALLAAEFQRLGGCLRANERRPESGGEGIVRATGRRTQTAVRGWRWFGLKAHARQVQMDADLEMHLRPNGYVGLCQLGSETVNVCGLFRSRAAVPDLAQNWTSWLQGGGEDSPLRQRLAAAEFVPGSFCAVSGLRLRPQTAAAHPECCLGDALTMIAPLTGNGMSMAFESAHLAVAPLADYSAGNISWATAAALVAQSCDRAFARRLRWSHWLQHAFFHMPAATGLFWLGSRSPVLWRALFARTRS